MRKKWRKPQPDAPPGTPGRLNNKEKKRMNEMVYTTPADIRKIIAEIVEAKKKLGGIKRAYCVARCV